MRRVLAAAAVAGCLAASSFRLTPAAAVTECDRYGDKPCVVFCEVFDEWWERLAPLFPDPVARPAC